ncbi:acyl-CoA thioesterase (plasmid) [Pseudorhodobacter turbinis]|uniref:Acyl-CoA thioesterase n=1 Tax=Pseudorhodobacter turbinis TaxID=2500533 RepID=A0A4P8EKB3_9RHOB|nr:acyl-CoA thioesterase [Pseudorhodobacter turbinis]QCO57506.1 acyl-CoA thioesterase [Pseudorhodobacter turbinis]
MYPYLRMFKELWKFRNAPPLPILGTHISHHRCWPQDIDPWWELNNGRTLTLYDLGRLPLGQRTGLHKTLKANGWGMTVAGASTRYRRRVRLFHRIEMVTRCIGWDARFIYIEQSMWKDGECTSHVLLRSAITSKAGIVPPEQVLQALGQSPQSPALPDWVQGWIDADADRPWPPVRA